MKKKNVLFLASDVGIYPLNSGRSQYAYGLCDEFSKYVNLHVISPVAEGIVFSDVEKALSEKMDIVFIKQGRGYHELLTHPMRTLRAYNSGLSIVQTEVLEEAKRIIVDYDVDTIIVDYLRNAMYFQILKKIFPTKKFIYNSHNAEYVNMEKEYAKDRQNSFLDKMLAASRLNKIIAWEKKIILETDRTLSISKDDIKLLTQKFTLPESKFLTSKPLIHYKKIKNEDSLGVFHYRLLIVGTMHWGALVNGVLWFVENVFPAVVQKDSRYKLFLVGANPCEQIKQLAEKYPDHIIVTGTVKDVSEYYDKCDISIIPMFEGTGTKLKVLESLCSGIPTISTTLAAKDYELTDEVLISNTADEFIENIQLLTENNKLRIELYRKMQNYINNYYSLDDSIIEQLQN